MNKRRVTITIPPEPTEPTKVEADGYEGQGCQSATGPIENALGRRTSDIKKPEFHKMADGITDDVVSENDTSHLEDDLGN